MNSKLPLIALLALCFFIFKQADAQTDFTGVSRLNLTSKTQENFTEVSFQSEGQKSPLQLFKKPKLKYSLLGSKSRASSFPKYSNNYYTTTQNDQKMNLNRRLKYSSLWAFTCLNYLYADVIGLMDMNLLNQYQEGVVNGIEISPAFLTTAAAYMQIPLSNVFLPHVIKNENTLRWIQIISGSIATLAQGATLFVGEPSPNYILFSALEMGVTSYIVFDAIKWKAEKKKERRLQTF